MERHDPGATRRLAKTGALALALLCLGVGIQVPNRAGAASDKPTRLEPAISIGDPMNTGKDVIEVYLEVRRDLTGKRRRTYRRCVGREVTFLYATELPSEPGYNPTVIATVRTDVVIDNRHGDYGYAAVPDPGLTNSHHIIVEIAKKRIRSEGRKWVCQADQDQKV